MTPVIEACDIHFAYQATPVLRGVDLRVQPGEIVTILGPNGAGKTTLIEIILGTYAPNKGAVSIFGENPRQTSAHWSRTGLVQQLWRDHGKWRVIDHLAWIKACFESSCRTTCDIESLLKQVELTDKRNVQLRRLSGGARRSIDCISALIGNPELLILDEPTAGIDPLGKIYLHDLIADAAGRGTAVLMTTHDLIEAEKLSSRINVLDGGIFIASGSVAQIRDHLHKPAEVVWIENGMHQVHATDDVESFVATLDLDRISGLTITRPTLEDAYINLIQKQDAS